MKVSKTKTCKSCKRKVIGRADKIFCSLKCKNNYHKILREYTAKFTEKIDKILHRNHSILSEVLTTKKKKILVKRIVLEQKKFQFNYHTHLYVNSKEKTYHYLYNTAWMEFSDNEIMITRQ